jgi:uncharacterized delta-60 repeat protein
MKRIIRGVAVGCFILFYAGRGSASPDLTIRPGTIDDSFNVLLDREVGGVVLQPDRKIVVCGAFTNVNGILSRSIVRLNRDGTIDTSFRPIINGFVWTVALQSNGQMLIAGTFTQVNGSPRNRMALLNSNGSLDPNFVPGHNQVWSEPALQSDGKVVFGVFEGVRRLNQNGSRDTNFVVEVNDFGYVAAVTVQKDGKILIGGDFYRVNGVARESVARLNSDGTVDMTFDTSRQNLGYDNRELIQQDDGSVLMGGDVTAKLTPQGRLSPDFTPRYSNVPEVFTMTLDGTNIIVGGEFPGFELTRTNLARLMPNGVVDPTYDPAAGANGRIYSTCVQSDGRLLVGGAFTVFAGQAKPYLVRLYGDQPKIIQSYSHASEFVTTWPSRFSNWVLQASQDVGGTNWTPVEATVLVTSNQCVVTNASSSSKNFFRLVGP